MKRQSKFGLTLMAMLGLAAASPAQQAEEVDVRALKEKVALTTRMLVRQGLVASSGHVSMRIPGTDRVLVGSRDASREFLRPRDVVTVDLDANKIEGEGRMPRETEIHTGIYRARPDVGAVIHSHPKHSVVFSFNSKKIVPVTVHGAIFADGVPVHDHVGHVNTRELGDDLARALGSHKAVLMKMHGAVVVGPTLEEAFVYALHLEENAEKQLLAEASGTLVPMSREEIEECLRVAFGESSMQKRWQYYLAREESLMGRRR